MKLRIALAAFASVAVLAAVGAAAAGETASADISFGVYGTPSNSVTANLGATYPDVFAAIAVHSGGE